MLNALRMDDIRVSLSLSGIDDNDDQVRPVASVRGTYSAPPDRYVLVKATVQNLTRKTPTSQLPILEADGTFIRITACALTFTER